MRILGCNNAFLMKTIVAEKGKNGLPEAKGVTLTNFIR